MVAVHVAALLFRMAPLYETKYESLFTGLKSDGAW